MEIVMELYIDDEINYPFDFNVEEIAKKVIQATLDSEGCLNEVEVSLLLTSDESIRKLNKEYRNIDNPTDVLSFPVNDKDILEEVTGKLILGDIVISVDTLIKQAEEYGHSFKREFAFLIVHSMLHLLGFDHGREDESIVMENKQDNILNKLEMYR